MREIASIFGLPDKPIEIEIPNDLVSRPRTFIRSSLIQPLQHISTMSRYNSEFPYPVAFPPQAMTNVLAEWLAKQGVKQSHIAETEKYAHVTFFFNGGVEKQFEDEERHMIPSPKVATYDKQPPMSVQGVADKVAEVVKKGDQDFVMCNFAPPDMVCVQVSAGCRQDTNIESRLATPVSTMLPLRPSPLPTRQSASYIRPARKLATSFSSPLIMVMPSR